MAVNGKFANIRRAVLLELADRYAIVDVTAVLKDVAAAVDSWIEHAAAAAVPAQTRDAIAVDRVAFTIR